MSSAEADYDTAVEEGSRTYQKLTLLNREPQGSGQQASTTPQKKAKVLPSERDASPGDKLSAISA